MKKRAELLKQLKDAYGRLGEAIAIDMSNELAVDGTIQRFEFCYELSWKTIKAFLEHEGIICNSPRQCLKEAFRIGWIDDEKKWLELLDARNMTTHIYDEKMVLEIYNTIKVNHVAISLLIEKLSIK